MATSSIRVLVVDDYQPIRQFLSSRLQNTSGVYVCWEASDGLEAVQKVEELQPDVILLDIRLPKLNGIEGFARFKDNIRELGVVYISRA